MNDKPLRGRYAFLPLGAGSAPAGGPLPATVATCLATVHVAVIAPAVNPELVAALPAMS